MDFNPVSPDDYSAIANVMGAYQQMVDEGDEEGYASLFTEDGAVLGIPGVMGPPDSFKGHEGVKAIARHSFQQGGGSPRHFMCGLTASYGDTGDEAHARYYILLPNAPGEAVMTVAVRTHLVRADGRWKIRTNTLKFG